VRFREVIDGSTECRSDGNMAILSRAASRPCQKSIISCLYQQRLDSSVSVCWTSQGPFDLEIKVTRRLLKRFSRREGMEGHDTCD
jgi:hypothetical protein